MEDKIISNVSIVQQQITDNSNTLNKISNVPLLLKQQLIKNNSNVAENYKTLI